MKEPKREARRKKIVELVKADGAKPTPEVVGVSRATLWRDLTALEQQGQLAITVEDRRQMVNAQYEVLLRMEKAAIEGTLDPDVINAWNRVRESIARLLGLNAPARSESVNVNVETDPQKLVGYRKFTAATRHLDEEQMTTVYAFIASIPPRPRVDLSIPDVDLDALQLKGETECKS